MKLEILKRSINGYEKIVEDGLKPIYRSKEWKSVICVPATPVDELAKMFRKIEKEQRKENKK